MSLRVLVIPEDPTYNGAILKPLAQRLLAECGKASASVEVLTNPQLRGVSQIEPALPAILARYAHFHLFLCFIDADGRDRSPLAQRLEQLAKSSGCRLLCCVAVQEIEAWLLAGHFRKLEGLDWRSIRDDVNVKETVFQSFLAEHGDRRRPAGGREVLMNQALGNWRGMRKRCPELADFQTRVCTAVEAAP